MSTEQGSSALQGENAAPASPETTAPEKSQLSEVEAIMEFDPFGPAKPASADSGQPAAEKEKTEDTGSKDASGQDAPPKEPDTKPDDKPADPQTPPVQQGPTPKEQELQAQVNALNKVIQDSRMGQQPQGQQPQGQGQPQQPAQPYYQLGVPPELVASLRSEDDAEFGEGLAVLVNGIANRVWNDVNKHLTDKVLPAFRQEAGSVYDQRKESDRVYNEFYGTYKHLNNPAIYPLVQNAATQVAQQWQMLGKPLAWNQEFMQAVAALVHTVVPQPQAQQQQQPVGQPPQTSQQPAPQTFTSQPGSRPAVAPGNDFMDVLTAR